MQISTREKDFIVDTLVLREDLHVLNDVFTRQSIVKVFHGADSDVEWLQRDLSLYIVNMFDTHQASKRLNFARLSLAFLLKHYCNIDADKTFQLADWRMRPLPESLLKYAQQDTHYLLYIYDNIKNDLLNLANGQSTLVKGVFHDSKIICLKRFIKPVMTDNSHKDLYLKSKRSFDNQQLFALREIFAWRDKIAREEDESHPYVLPNHMLLQICESLPREIQGILACCNPIPPLVRQHLNFLHQIILKAREQPVIKPIVSDKDNVRQSVNLNSKKDLLHNPLYSPHDLSHNFEIRDDLPTLIGDVKLKDSFEGVKVFKVKLGIFNKQQNRNKVRLNFLNVF
jgi:exosome complex exonuclease RRP6